MAHCIYKNRAHREAKARTIVAILEDRMVLAGARGLEIGTGAGYMSAFFAGKMASLDSVDVVDEREETAGYVFRRVEGVGLPFADESFDLVISNQVIEHLSEQERHLAEAVRVLRPGGCLYVATPNRLWPREVHSRLWGLGWLPRGLASRYFRWRRGGEWDVYPLRCGQLRAMFRRHPLAVTDYAPLILKRTDRYHYIGNARLTRWARVIPSWLLAGLSPLMPSFFFLGQKAVGPA